jgi:non-ribosomal peptide synthase protein (TIGR01720 family)
MRALGERFLKSVRGVIEHCRKPEAGGHTPSDFPLANVDQAQLDKLRSRLKKKR